MSTEPPAGADRVHHALGLAYRYLDRRDRTVAEVRTHLKTKGVESEVLEEALRELSDQGYLDDARFVRLFADDKRRLEEWGNDRIRRTLLARGIDRDLVTEALSAEPQSGELDRARALLARRFPQPPAEPRERERALAVLLRKGYDSELALEAIAGYSVLD